MTQMRFTKSPVNADNVGAKCSPNKVSFGRTCSFNTSMRGSKLAFANSKRGYKKLPHFQIGLWDTHMFVWFAIIYECLATCGNISSPVNADNVGAKCSPNKVSFGRTCSKKLPHFQIGLWDTHMFVWFAIIYESPIKEEYGRFCQPAG
jgi:hypothetical protein